MSEHDYDLEDARHVRLLQWLLTPPTMRVPDTLMGLAKEIGVAPKTLRDWKRSPKFRAVWEQEAVDTIATPEQIQNVLKQLYADATDTFSENSTPASRTKAGVEFLKATDAMKPPEVGMLRKKAAELSDAELDAMLAEYAQQEKAARERG